MGIDKKMISSLKKIFWVSRPVSWLNTAFPFAVGYLAANQLEVNAFLIIATFYFLWPYNLLMYGINDVFDYESDIRNPRKGGIEGMKEEKALHPLIIKSVLILNIPLLAYLFLNGNFLANVILSILIFDVVAYSIKGLRFKEKPFLDSISSSLHFVGPLIYGLSLTQDPIFPMSLILAFFLWGMASHAFGAIQDIIPDREAKLSSIATVLGAQKTIYFVATLYLSVFILLVLNGGYASVVAIASLSYLVNISKYFKINDKRSAETNKAWKRFIWLNYFVGFIITITLILSIISN